MMEYRSRPGIVPALGLMGAVLCLAFGLAVGPLRAQEGVAIVVHPDTPIEELSLQQLRQVFLADQQFWPDGSRITLFVRAPAAYERDVILNRIYRMSEDDFRKYWVGKMFRAEIPAGPKIVYSSEMAAELVTAVRGAITFVPAHAVAPTLKVIRIGGRLPGEPGYPLQ